MRDQNDAYEIAKSGGKHSGFLEKMRQLGDAQRKKSLVSIENQANLHKMKISDPKLFVPDWDSRSQQYRDGLLAKWNTEIDNFNMQAAILKGLKDE